MILNRQKYCFLIQTKTTNEKGAGPGGHYWDRPKCWYQISVQKVQYNDKAHMVFKPNSGNGRISDTSEWSHRPP